jgi:hypothetical protein
VADLGATLDFVGNTKVHVAQQASGLEKRQATVQLMFHPSALKAQPRIAVIFRGAGHVSSAERAAYDSRVDVYFQVCAYAPVVPVCTCCLYTVLAASHRSLRGSETRDRDAHHSCVCRRRRAGQSLDGPHSGR